MTLLTTGIGAQARARREAQIARQPLDQERITRMLADAHALTPAQHTNVIVSLSNRLQDEAGDEATPNPVTDVLPGLNVRTARALLHHLRAQRT
jgi:hypothetical protein